MCSGSATWSTLTPRIFTGRIRVRAQLTCTSNCSSQGQASWLECVCVCVCVCVESLPNSFLSQLSSTTHFLSLSPETSIKISMHAKSLQLCPTLLDPMNCSRPGSSVHGDSFSRQEHWSGLPCPHPGDLPNPEIELVCLLHWPAGFFFFTTSAT